MPPFRRGDLRRARRQVYGGQPLPLPLVTTLTAGSVTATSADLFGSIDPQGLTATWWFAWGTTPTFGSTTSTQSLGATSIPQAVNLTITGLTTGTTYWFALVGQTAGGTVQAFPLSFVAQTAQPVTNPTNPPASTSTPAIAVPHFQFPFTFDPVKGAAVVEQDSYGEILSCVQAVCACQIGSCPELPTFGIPDPTFQPGPPDMSGVVSAVQLWEPRATVDAVDTAINGTNADWAVALTASFRAPSDQ